MSEAAGVWSGIRPPVEGLSAKLHPRGGGVWLALDPQGRRHLLVRADQTDAGETLMTTRGLRAATELLSVEQEPLAVWADIACLDPVLNDMFLTVADDLAEEVAQHPGDPLEAVRRILSTWRWFWGVDPTALSTESAVGLFGELWFLDRWAPFPSALQCWVGPTGYRHDFTAAAVSVEVKATRLASDGSSTSPDQQPRPTRRS